MDKNIQIEVERLCINGMCTDGGHHKQWFLEKILQLVASPETLSAIEKEGYEWEGIAP